MNATDAVLTDPALLDEVDLARAAAQQEAADEEVGAHVGAQVEGETAVTHLFEAAKPGYRGWRWAATVASGGPDTDVTVSEVVLQPGPDALVAPDWVPWEHRVKAGDLGVGDLLPTAPDDPRLVPAYVASDDPAVEEVAREAGLGRARVMARPARLEAAARWQHSEFGPRSDMARGAPAHCGTCGFYLPLAGSLRVAFGTCGNELAPADGHVVHAEYGCGAHSEAEVEQVSPVLVANLIYDDALLDVEPIAPAAVAPAAAEPTTPEPADAEAEPTAAEPTAAEPVDAEPVDAEPVEAPAGEVTSTETTQPEATTAEPAPSETAAAEPAQPAAGEPVEAEPTEAEATAGVTSTETPQPEATTADLASGEAAESGPAEAAEPVVTAETPLGASAPSTLTPWIRPEGEAKRTELPEATDDTLEPYHLISPEPTPVPDEPAAPATAHVHATDPHQLEFPTDVAPLADAEPPTPTEPEPETVSDSVTAEPSAPPAADHGDAPADAGQAAPNLEPGTQAAPESSEATDSATEPDPSTVMDAAPEPVPGWAPEPESATEPESAAGPEPDSTPEPDPAPAGASDETPEPDSTTALESDSAPAPLSVSRTVPDSATAPESDSTPEPASDSTPQPDSATAPESDSAPEPDSEPESGAESGSAPDGASDGPPEGAPNAAPEPEGNSGRRSFGWNVWGGAGERPEGD
jgi:hypothetical protein